MLTESRRHELDRGLLGSQPNYNSRRASSGRTWGSQLFKPWSDRKLLMLYKKNALLTPKDGLLKSLVKWKNLLRLMAKHSWKRDSIWASSDWNKTDRRINLRRQVKIPQQRWRPSDIDFEDSGSLFGCYGGIPVWSTIVSSPSLDNFGQSWGISTLLLPICEASSQPSLTRIASSPDQSVARLVIQSCFQQLVLNH